MHFDQLGFYLTCFCINSICISSFLLVTSLTAHITSEQSCVLGASHLQCLVSLHVCFAVSPEFLASQPVFASKLTITGCVSSCMHTCTRRYPCDKSPHLAIIHGPQRHRYIQSQRNQHYAVADTKKRMFRDREYIHKTDKLLLK